eukprot:GILJ01009303.1.p1 GENE.GILJ01009303.1~~GILJ01009303.1.p1  ORF type:complete len:864 (-),score=131.97 GILJ01009303.1:247-2838(-)
MYIPVSVCLQTQRDLLAKELLNGHCELQVQMSCCQNSIKRTKSTVIWVLTHVDSAADNEKMAASLEANRVMEDILSGATGQALSSKQLKILSRLFSTFDLDIDDVDAYMIAGCLSRILETLTSTHSDVKLKESCFEAIASLSLSQRHRQDIKQLLLQALQMLDDRFDEYFREQQELELLQGGAGGSNLVLHLLQVLFVIYDFKMKAHDLLELTDGRIDYAVSGMSALLRNKTVEADHHMAAARLMYELTLSDSIFDAQERNEASIQTLTKTFNNHSNRLIKATIQYDVFASFFSCLAPAVRHSVISANQNASSQHLQTVHVIFSYWLHMVQNLLQYCTESALQFRKHVAMQTQMIPELLLPYFNLLMDVLAKGESIIGSRSLEYMNMKLALKTFTLVSFKIKVFRKDFRLHNFTTRLLTIRGLHHAAELISLLIKFNINIAFAGEIMGDMKTTPELRIQAGKTLKAIVDFYSTLSPEQRIKLARRLNADDPSVPLTKSGLSFEILRFCFECSDPSVALMMFDNCQDIKAAPSSQPLVPRNSKKQKKKKKKQNRKRSNAKNRPSFVWQTKLASTNQIASNEISANESNGPIEDEESDEDGEDGEEECTRQTETEAEEQDVQTQMGGELNSFSVLCALGGHLMTEPVRSPYGHVFDRSAIEDWLQNNNNICPFTHQPLHATDLTVCNVSTEEIGEYVMSEAILQAEPTVELGINLTTVDSSSSSEVCSNPIEFSTHKDENSKFRLLGNLPPLSTGRPPVSTDNRISSESMNRDAKEKRKTRKKEESNPGSMLENIPEEFCCAIDGKLIREPVTSPYGHNFERSSLMKWLSTHDGRCPVTDKPLTVEDVFPNQYLETKIRQWMTTR